MQKLFWRAGGHEINFSAEYSFYRYFSKSRWNVANVVNNVDLQFASVLNVGNLHEKTSCKVGTHIAFNLHPWVLKMHPWCRIRGLKAPFMLGSNRAS